MIKASTTKKKTLYQWSYSKAAKQSDNYNLYLASSTTNSADFLLLHFQVTVVVQVYRIEIFLIPLQFINSSLCEHPL